MKVQMERYAAFQLAMCLEASHTHPIIETAAESDTR
jgi:hypothetical protein